MVLEGLFGGASKVVANGTCFDRFWNISSSSILQAIKRTWAKFSGSISFFVIGFLVTPHLVLVIKSFATKVALERMAV